MQRCVIDQDFPFPVERLFAELGDHERLGRILGAPMKRIADGSGPGGVNGVGSIRQIASGPAAFEETIVTYVPNELIEYKVTKGGPIKNHLGRMEFSANGSGSRLHYVITFESKIPFVGGLIERVLEGAAKKGLAKYAKAG